MWIFRQVGICGFLGSTMKTCQQQQKVHQNPPFYISAVYEHNVAPISGMLNVTPFSLVLGRDAPSPETISLELPPRPLPHDHYAKHILSRLSEAGKQFSQIKADIRHQQREIYDMKACNLAKSGGKIVYMCKTPSTSRQGHATRFIHHFDGPYQVTGHPFNRPDMLTLKYLATGETIPHLVNIEKVVVIPDPEVHDLQDSNDTVIEFVPDDPPVAPLSSPPDNDLVQVTFQFGKFLQSLPSKSATASQAYTSVYESYPSSLEILACHGRLHGLVKTCPYLLDGGASGETYVLSLNQTLCDQVLHKKYYGVIIIFVLVI